MSVYAVNLPLKSIKSRFSFVLTDNRLYTPRSFDFELGQPAEQNLFKALHYF